MTIQNKNVFITGSTRGIGLAIAHQFASLGANVVLNGRSQVSPEILESFQAYPGQAIAITGDISQAEEAKRMVDEAIERLGSVDILVNNAGITNDKLVLKMTEEDFESVLKVNLTGAFNMTQSVLKPMTRARQGVIINISSVVGLTGFIASNMTDVIPEKMQKAIVANIPMKRIGKAEEVATVATFLAEQDYLTGQVIAIDGGMTMQS
ncbi:3-oxoacyl-[acyl-carrier-protein] reductase FabG-like [Vulpes lagopus]|uniref:3-oxoacyl-[acyl-carrier-protein] reductase FabG-like n=1 Tax=Vulpes lagopus TaxID=494514 RepID=UPI001BCA3785|nr:3-oxoacyl-[acyl-carrier-protein] reductase FabG-like [Vulpes lagopus]